jgi:hypothetical protein
MDNANSQVALMLRLLSKTQREMAQLSPENQRELLSALSDGIGEANGSHTQPSSAAQAPTKPATKVSKRRPKKSPKAGRKSVSGSIADLAIKAVLDADGALSAGEALAAVHEARPKANPNAVYAALHTAAKNGTLSQEMIGNKAAYSKPRGGR